MNNAPVITVDGPSGSGKGTVSLQLADELGWHHLDSGALYRLLAYAALKNALELDDEAALLALADEMREVRTICHGGKKATMVVRTGPNRATP